MIANGIITVYHSHLFCVMMFDIYLFFNFVMI